MKGKIDEREKCNIYLVSVVKIIKGRKDIISDGVSWVGIGFFVCGVFG